MNEKLLSERYQVEHESQRFPLRHALNLNRYIPDNRCRIGATYVDNELRKLSPHQIAELQRGYPLLPDDYFNYMASVGWGETGSGRMIYEGPTSASEIYGSRSELRDIVVLGDDHQGYCFGFNMLSGRYGEVSDAGQWEEWSLHRGVFQYVEDADCTKEN